MTFSAPLPFKEAIAQATRRKVMPTHLGSAELRTLNRKILRDSFFSARNTLEPSLSKLKDLVERILQPGTEARPDGTTASVGMDLATARLEAKKVFAELGYQPDPDKRGSIQDLSSDRRINLVVETNVQIAQGYGNFIQGQDEEILQAYPAQELYRAESRGVARNWQTRWNAAASATGDTDAARVLAETGRMIARKDSPIWQALGDGVGGFDDTLGNPFPPFAFQSGMDVKDVGRREAVRLGLITQTGKVQPQGGLQ